MEQIIGQFGLPVKMGIVVVIIILIEYLKPVVKAWKPGLVVLLPLVMPLPAVLFLSPEIHMPGTDGHGMMGVWHLIRELGAQWFYYVAGTFLGYNVLWAKIKPFMPKNLKKESE